MIPISVIIGTRDRPDDLARCLPTILACDYSDFEVMIVDQSSTDASERVVDSLCDPRLRYWRQRVAGKSRALNDAMAQARGEIIALTDDDCTVPAGWLQRAVDVLEAETEAGIIFGTVAAAPHDARETFVPIFMVQRYRRLQGRFARARCRGLGANMIVRRAVLDRLVGFDECLGPGSVFRSAIETDFAHRALRLGFAVVHDPANIVVHWGKRAYADGSVRRLLRNNYYGIGARLIKQVRCGDPLAAYGLLHIILQDGMHVVANVIRRRRGTGAARLQYLMLGVIRGLRQPLDHRRRLYVPAADRKQ